MPAILDAIVVKDLVGSRGNTPGSYNMETLNTDGHSISVDCSGTEDNLQILVVYANGASVDFEVTIQGSADNFNFADITETTVGVSDSSGSITFDLNGTRPNYLRLGWVANSGSIDIQCTFYGRRRH